MAWEREDTERWLTRWPLPPDFKWKGQVAWPLYELKHGYGQWLRTAGSYHRSLRGLFLLCHDLLAALPVGAPMPSPEDLAAQLRALETIQGTLGIEPADEPDQVPQPEPNREYQGPGVARAASERGNLTQPLADSWPTS